LRGLSIGAATVAAAFLIYGTFEWLEEIWTAGVGARPVSGFASCHSRYGPLPLPP